MIKIEVCPGNLTPGFDKYSPEDTSSSLPLTTSTCGFVIKSLPTSI